MEAKKTECAGVLCAESLPLDYYIARCVDNVCVERESSCGEEIESPDNYVAILRSHPALEQLNLEMNLLDVQILDSCVIDGKVRAKLRYELPAYLSSYNVRYTTDWIFYYHVDDGKLEFGSDPAQGSADIPTIFDPNVIMGPSIEKINQIENDPRVSEFLTRAVWYPALGNVYLSTTTVRLSARRGYIEFSFPFEREEGLVTHYYLPNFIEWVNFPEVVQAHQLIQENLLVGDWEYCIINRGKTAHSGTLSTRLYEEDEPWWIDVDLDCDGEWKTAGVNIFPDGSYQRLGFR
jgi:hypothetical protein